MAANDVTVRTVLLVEDGSADRTMIHRLLRGQKRGYRVVDAATAAAGLEHCRASASASAGAPPDCVLLDFRLPDMDALEFLDALRHGADGRVPLPVAVLTGLEDDDAAAEALRRGAEDYLVKDDLTGRALVRAIENAIEKFRIRRELDEQRTATELRNRRLEALRDELQARMLELADATRTKDRFLAVMSHEMRTPLNAILGYSELLEMELEGRLTDGQRQQVERIRVGSRHLLDLTNDVLDLTRADARKLELDLRPVDLCAVVEEVTALLARQAQTKGIELVAEPCAPEMPLVHGDLPRLRQVLTNLVGNAIKFTDQGWVRVRCHPAGADGRVRVEVSDSGIGIEPASLPFVFNEFYQVKDELTRRHGGSGLGLAISQRLMHLMDGDIEVASDPGTGSTFTLLLHPATAGSEPLADDAAPADAPTTAEAGGDDPGVHRGPARTATVVAFGSDGAALAELERRVAPGVRLVWTTDPDAVPAVARAERAALVVLDAGSGDGAAWRAAHAIQDDPELAAAAVLLLPSISDALPDETATMLALGWVSLVAKPFTAAQLTHAVSAAARTGVGRRAAGAAPEAATGCTVLVVDDDPDSRRVAARFLAEAGVGVREAPDGETALGEMRAHPPDVVILDLMMPVLDGFGVLAAMRADPTLASLPVVVLTATSLTDAERRFLARTAVRVLEKGAHRLADVAALVLRTASHTRRDAPAAQPPAARPTADAT